jgi:hypothetical protein
LTQFKVVFLIKIFPNSNCLNKTSFYMVNFDMTTFSVRFRHANTLVSMNFKVSPRLTLKWQAFALLFALFKINNVSISRHATGSPFSSSRCQS